MTGHIFIYGGIGTERGEVSFDNVLSQLQLPENKSAEELVLHIISPGGDVQEGESIYNALKNTGKNIVTHIEGICASIATLIAGAGNKIIMNKTGRFMIHNPKITGLTKAADSRDLRHVADQLDIIKTLLINVYDKKTSLGKEKLWELYDNETWLTADEAEKMGFIDESVDAIKAVAKIDINKIINMKKDRNLWDRIQNLLSLSKFTNEVNETLQDGTPIIIMSEDGAWEGKQVILADGSALPDGDHALASGKTITVSGGVISAVKEAAAEDKQNEEMDNKIKELEAQLAEAMAAKETAMATAKSLEAKVVTSEAKALKFENRLAGLEKDFLKLKEEASETIGDTKDPDKGPAFKNMGNPQRDHMGEAALSHFKSRNIVK